ncbi:hypothetical protein BROUX41_006767 [Berkeleyomyces rouxiae]|uniref:uncharacterized protein n=1 Tax=Berkeleyomyces rouxiae TaxID=2035830 RepID=UPI003B7C75B4
MPSAPSAAPRASDTMQRPMGCMTGAPGASGQAEGHVKPSIRAGEEPLALALVGLFLALYTVSVLVGLRYYSQTEPRYSQRMAFKVLLVAVPYVLCVTLVYASVSWSQQIDMASSFISSLITIITSPSSSTPTSASAESPWYAVPNVLDVNAEDCQKECPGYAISNVVESDSGLTGDLNLAGQPCNIYGTDILNLSLIVEYQEADRLHVEIRPRFIGPKNATWLVLPEKIVPKPARGNGCKQSSDLEFVYQAEPTFSYGIIHRATNATLFSTTGSKLVYADQFFEFVTQMPPSYNLYGLGESIGDFHLGTNRTRTLWAADVADQVDRNLYGSHPIYLETRYYEAGSATPLNLGADQLDPAKQYSSHTHGVFLRNAHGQDVLLRDSQVTWRALGGSIDLYFYAGPTAANVMAAYQRSAVGLPAMQQYWTFGYHQSRWGYKKWEDLQEVAQRMQDAGIWMETIWSDIDYMDRYRDFTTAPTGFPLDQFSRFLNSLHARGQHYVPIIDAAIFRPNHGEEASYPPYQRGIAKNAFIMADANGSEYVGRVWPGYTVFPDFVGPSLGGDAQTDEWWTDEIKRLHSGVKFDGLWIDMNEVSSFCEGNCGAGALNGVADSENLGENAQSDQLDELKARVQSMSGLVEQDAATFLPADINPDWRHSVPVAGHRNLDNPPYAINHIFGHMAKKTVAPSAHHHVPNGAVQYDFHNLFGHQMLAATRAALLALDPEKRPFIIGRSTFAGSGALAGHWGGDNFSLWEYLRLSISQGLSFSIFGVPMFGTDACGFLLNSNEELCARWMQLNAFLPFFRNHNTHDAVAQEPYRWPSVAAATRTALRARYALLSYLYTLFWTAHTRGDTVLRALAWEFPNEPWLATVDYQFLLGSSLMVAPVLDAGATSVRAMLPNAVWYDWWTLKRTPPSEQGVPTVFDAPLGHIPLFVRGGSMLPLHARPANTTAGCRRSPWALLVALDDAGHATGELYLDDGESEVPAATRVVELTAAQGTLEARASGNYEDVQPLARVTVLGAGSVRRMQFNGAVLEREMWKWDAKRDVLEVDLESATQEGAWTRNWTLVVV